MGSRAFAPSRRLHTPCASRWGVVVPALPCARSKALFAFAPSKTMLDTLLRDVRFAWRNLRRTPALTSVAVLSIALGIAATTSVVSVVDAALLRPPPLVEADRLAILFMTRQDFNGPSAMLRW